MAKQITCGDVVPGCEWKGSAPTDDDLLKQVAAHAAEAHGVKEVSPELAAQVKAAIRTR
jgi:predicted small metal-binding protein